MLKSISLLVALLLISGLAPPPARAGSAGFAFLEIPTGARASALGGALVSMGRGVEASFWNPAGLDRVQGVQVMGGHYELYQKLRHDHFAAAWRMLGLGVSGSIRALYTEPIAERDELGNLIGSFGVDDLELGLGLGKAIAPGVAAGVSGQIVRERIANASATTYSFGLGATVEPAAWPNLRAGLTVSNLGPAAAYTIDGIRGEDVPLPTAVQAGASYDLDVTSHLTVRGALEGRLTRGRSGVGLIGAEVANPAGAALRLGLRLNDDVSSVSMGAGYTIKRLHLDYAYVPVRLDLGDTHRFSFATQF